ncbi:MAG: hypothetical protein LBB53_04710 [Prevotellaceae bacterium]|jgi:hypothetical protein|nr:hypothetical protein [Prevotellaceae bacterium]
MPKSQKHNLSEIIRYIPAYLQELPCGDWRIIYYAKHPQKEEFQHVRIRVSKIKDALAKKSEARRYISEIIQTINAKLAGGWSPFFEDEDSRLYIDLRDVCKYFIEEKTKELRPATMTSYKSFCNMLCEWADKNAPKIYASLFNHNYTIRYMDYI